MPGTVRATVACALACVVALVATGMSESAATQPPAWERCGRGIECTTVVVPQRHDRPDGDGFAIRVARIPAGETDRRLGILVVNPGGPGVSAVDRLAGLAGILPGEVRERFDIVAFDSRGVDASTHVDCAPSLDDVFDASFSPADDSRRADLVAAMRAVADECARRNGDLLHRVSTVDTARDLDLVRRALGERRLNFLGYSYGTYLGSVYAALFPDRVRALVLDGAVDPDVNALESVLLQARGFEANLGDFLAECSAEASCAFHRDGRSAEAYDALRARLASEPLTVGSARDHRLNDTRFDAAVLQLLYGGRGEWGTLARALDQADRGEGDTMLTIADRFVGRRADGRDDDTVEAFWAISCLDGPFVEGVDAMTEIERRVRAEAPRLGGFVVNFSFPCAVWPARGEGPRPSIVGAAPGALVVNSARDPATPLVSARRLARTLGDAALVVAPGDRHTAVASGSDCVDETVAGYLVAPNRARPRVTRC